MKTKVKFLAGITIITGVILGSCAPVMYSNSSTLTPHFPGMKMYQLELMIDIFQLGLIFCLVQEINKTVDFFNFIFTNFLF
jgi:hypothetical protein